MSRGSEYLRAEIDLATSGTHLVIPAASMPGRRVFIHQIVLWPWDAVTVVYLDDSTTINGAGFNLQGAGHGAHVLEGEPLLQVTSFSISLSDNVAVTGWVTYRLGYG